MPLVRWSVLRRVGVVAAVSSVVLGLFAPSVATAATPTNQVTVVGVIPAGGTNSGSLVTDVTAAVNGPVHDFWAEQTNGAIELAATAWPGWVQVSVGCDDADTMWQEAGDAVGFVPGPGKHLLLAVSSFVGVSWPCEYSMAELGSGPGAGGVSYVRGAGSALIARQLGHNFGLDGSWSHACPGSMEGGSGGCTDEPEGDPYDVMSVNGPLGTLNPAHAARLGVLPASQYRVLAANDSPSATYTLLPTGGRTGLRAIKVVVPPSSMGIAPHIQDGSEYWLEYRTATGADAWLGTGANTRGLQSGVLLRRVDAGSRGSELLDGTPPATYTTDPYVALPVGRLTEVAMGQFTVTVESASAAGATVRVGFRGPWLTPGEELRAWGSRTSPNGAYSAQLQGDGALVVVAKGRREIWRSPGSGSGPRLIMQPDGNLVAYRSDGAVIWHAGTWGNPGARMVLQDDGNLVVYRADGVPLWWAGQDVPDQLRAGQSLAWDQYLVSRNGKYRAVGQRDGNLVVYGPAGRVVWANYVSDTGTRTVMQPDGNVVAYGSWNRVQWHSWTFGNPGAFLALQDDGNLVVYRANGTAGWWSGADRLR